MKQSLPPIDSAAPSAGMHSADAAISNPRLTGSLLIDLYRIFLFVLMVGYYAALVVAVINLGTFTLALFEVSLLAHPPLLALYGAFVLVSITLLCQMARVLWKGVLGLVTTMHDDEPAMLEGLALAKSDYPELYATVAEVARRVDAPLPDEIRVTSRGDGYVTERRHFSIAPARKLVLVLGLPHLSVLSVNELKVILAHELAHFRRGDTSLGVFVYRFLESLRVTIDDLSRRSSRWINPLYPFCALYFYLFLVLSAPIRRHQELRADCYSAAAYGGEFAAKTLIKEWLIAHQFDAAAASYNPSEVQAIDGQPLDVFTWFAASTWRDLSPEGYIYLQRRLEEEERPSFWDAYPTMNVRMKTMRSFGGRPPAGRTPARRLFHNFRQLQRQMHAELFADGQPSSALADALQEERLVRPRQMSPALAGADWRHAFRTSAARRHAFAHRRRPLLRGVRLRVALPVETVYWSQRLGGERQ